MVITDQSIFNQREVTLKLRKGEQSFLYATYHLNLRHKCTLVMSPYGNLIMARRRIIWKKKKKKKKKKKIYIYIQREINQLLRKGEQSF